LRYKDGAFSAIDKKPSQNVSKQFLARHLRPEWLREWNCLDVRCRTLRSHSSSGRIFTGIFIPPQCRTSFLLSLRCLQRTILLSSFPEQRHMPVFGVGRYSGIDVPVLYSRNIGKDHYRVHAVTLGHGRISIRSQGDLAFDKLLRVENPHSTAWVSGLQLLGGLCPRFEPRRKRRDPLVDTNPDNDVLVHIETQERCRSGCVFVCLSGANIRLFVKVRRDRIFENVGAVGINGPA